MALRRKPAALTAPKGRFNKVMAGAVAQLGERGVRNAEVRGSIPLRSTRNSYDNPKFLH